MRVKPTRRLQTANRKQKRDISPLLSPIQTQTIVSHGEGVLILVLTNQYQTNKQPTKQTQSTIKLSTDLLVLASSSAAVLGAPTSQSNVRRTKAAEPTATTITENLHPILVSGVTNPVHAQLLQGLAQQLADDEDRPKSAAGANFKSMEKIEPLVAYARSCNFLDLTCYTCSICQSAYWDFAERRYAGFVQHRVPRHLEQDRWKRMYVVKWTGCAAGDVPHTVQGDCRWPITHNCHSFSYSHSSKQRTSHVVCRVGGVRTPVFGDFLRRGGCIGVVCLQRRALVLENGGGVETAPAMRRRESSPFRSPVAVFRECCNYLATRWIGMSLSTRLSGSSL